MGLPLDQEQKSKFGGANVSEIELSGKLVPDWTEVIAWLRKLDLLAHRFFVLPSASTALTPDLRLMVK